MMVRKKALLGVLLGLAFGSFASGQGGRLEDLKREAAGDVAGLQVLTQQMVDQIFSFSELG